MIKGMTGFGAADVSWKQIKGSIEVKSQNHRYLDLVFYMPLGFSSYEDNVRQIIGKNIKRGRVTVSFKMSDKPRECHVINKSAIREYLTQARQLKKEFSFDESLSLSDLIKLPGVVEAKEAPLDLRLFWPVFEKGINKAVKSCLDMRQREGRSLAADLRKILKTMTERGKKIQEQTHSIFAEYKKKLPPEEFLSFQKGNDVSEEMARLKHYIEEFELFIVSQVNSGKQLDFIAQEMQRETNTIGSKMQDTVVANAVISLKSSIEKLREQAQNIE